MGTVHEGARQLVFERRGVLGSDVPNEGEQQSKARTANEHPKWTKRTQTNAATDQQTHEAPSRYPLPSRFHWAAAEGRRINRRRRSGNFKLPRASRASDHHASQIESVIQNRMTVRT